MDTPLPHFLLLNHCAEKHNEGAKRFPRDLLHWHVRSVETDQKSINVCAAVRNPYAEGGEEVDLARD